MKLRIALASRLPLYFLIAGLISLHACKNKKKLAEISDKEAVKEQIAEEMSSEEDAAPQMTDETAPVQLESRTISAEELSQSQKINKYFMEISSAGSYEKANQSINQTLTMFNSPDAPVLIIIYDNGSEVDYDEPTTIEKYLAYLKDTKNKPAMVEEIGRDASGKIKELVLRK